MMSVAVSCRVRIASGSMLIAEAACTKSLNAALLLVRPVRASLSCMLESDSPLYAGLSAY